MLPTEGKRRDTFLSTIILPDSNGGFVPCPELLTEEELIVFLRIPQISKSKDYHNVIENLKRVHGLPRIHICGKPLYLLEEIREWIRKKQQTEKNPVALWQTTGYNPARVNPSQASIRLKGCGLWI